MVRPDPSVLPKTLSEEFASLSLKKIFYQENQDLSDNEDGDVFFVIKELQKNIMKDANDSKHYQEVVLQKLNFVNIILTG